jgi:predicted dehydrogenase
VNEWEAMPQGGVGHYSYQWRMRWVYPDGSTSPWEALGTHKVQTLHFSGGEPDFDLQVTVSSGNQNRPATRRIWGACNEPGQVCPESAPDTES